MISLTQNKLEYIKNFYTKDGNPYIPESYDE